MIESKRWSVARVLYPRGIVEADCIFGVGLDWQRFRSIYGERKPAPALHAPITRRKKAKISYRDDGNETSMAT